MKVSREFAIEQLKLVRKNLSDWIRDLEKPTTMVEGEEVLIYEGGVPNGISVDSLEGIPAEQLAAELSANAGILLALANAGE